MQHLKDRSLIDYQFKLLDDELAAEVARHLDSCEQCRQRASQLARRLSSLDVLKGEPAVTEDLIKRTVARTEARPSDRPRIRVLPWVAVAAVALVAVTVTVSAWLHLRPGRGERQEAVRALTLDKSRQVQPSVAPTPAPAPTTGALSSGLAAETKAKGDQTTQSPAGAGGYSVASSAQPSQGIRQRLAANAPRPDSIELHPTDQLTATTNRRTPNSELRTASEEPPPFAPASAIELVTLPRRDGVQLTIYNSADLTFVRDRRSLTLKKGWNWLQFMWANTLIDPTSLELEPKEHGDQIDVTQLVYPARLKDVGRWLIHSEVDGRVPFEITYFTSGVSWRAFYTGTAATDEKDMRLEGYVRVTNNSGEDYEDAQVRLIVGQVHLLDQIAALARREYPYGSPVREESFDADEAGGRRRAIRLGRELMDKAAEAPTMAGALVIKEIRKEGLSEYFLYTIEGTETIPNGWSKRMISFYADQVPVVNLCKYEEERYGRSVVRFLSFKNDKDHKLGLTPIPDGELEVCRAADEKGHLSFVGAAAFKYIPVGQEVELNLGQARDVVVEPKLMDLKKDSFRFDAKGDISGWDEIRAWRISVRNTREIQVKVEIRRSFPTAYWQLTRPDAVGAYEQVDKDTVKFTLDLAPRSSQSFEYQVRTYHGTREQDWQK